MNPLGSPPPSLPDAQRQCDVLVIGADILYERPPAIDLAPLRPQRFDSRHKGAS